MQVFYDREINIFHQVEVTRCKYYAQVWFPTILYPLPFKGSPASDFRFVIYGS